MVKPGFTKNRYRGVGLSKKGELWQFPDLRGGMARKREVVFFMKGLMPRCSLCFPKDISLTIEGLNPSRSDFHQSYLLDLLFNVLK